MPAAAKSRATLTMVAQKAGVSPSTVSRILNGTAQVSEEKQALVKAVIEELGLPMQAEGVAVMQAEDLSARAGVQRGDILLGINGAAVGTPADVLALAEMGSRVWVLDLIREGRALRLRFRF